jgi:5-methyltetrahydrofolate--homocysteine methyltransferase
LSENRRFSFDELKPRVFGFQKRRAEMTEALVQALVDMKEAEALQTAKQLLDQGISPMEILESCSKAMEVVGQRFEKGVYFLPHLMMAGEMLKQITSVIKPLIEEQKTGDQGGKVLIGTVEGDIHDIGKNIVVFLLEANGFQVRDIGINQKPSKFVEAIKEFQPKVVGMSGLLTLAFDSMKKTVQAIQEAGLRDRVKIVIGGGVVTEKIKEYSGADAYAPDAMAGVRLCKQWIGSE